MKKTISFLLVFCLFAFSLFSTGCGSSGGFKFLGAVVAIAVIASSGGAASSASAVFAANVRGGDAPTIINAKKTKVKVYKLDASADDLRGTPISDIAATFDDNKKLLSCTTGEDEEDRLQVGDYLFEVYNIDSKKVFLRAILHVEGNSNDVTLEISPVTEIKTAVYKEWLDKDPEVNSVKNFELNLTRALETAMKAKAVTYTKNLAAWNQTDDVEAVAVSDINVPTATKVAVTNNPIPADLKNATWRAIAANDIDGKQFVKRYMFDTDKKWIKFTNEGTDNLPYITFTNEPIGFHGFHKMTISYYSEDTMNGWAPVNNQFEIPEADVSNRITDNDSSNYKVSLGLKIEVNVLADGGKTTKITYDAKITSHNSKTYLHLKNADDEGIYELIPQPNNPIPADLKNANWRTITEDDIVGKQFGMRYIRDTETETGAWAKLTSVEIGRLPFLMFGSDLRDGYYSMNMDIYSDENLKSWLNPQSNEIPIPQVGWDEYLSYSCKVLPDSKIEVVNVDDEGNPIQGEKFNYDARITEYGGKTYLHIKSADDEEIYEVMTYDGNGSIR